MGSLLVCITHDCVHGYRDYKDRKAVHYVASSYFISSKTPKTAFFFWFSFLTSREKVLVRKKNKFRLELVKLVLFNVQCSPCLMLASFLQFLHSLQHTVLIMQTPMKVSN